MTGNSSRQAASKAFTIHPEGHALMTMAGMKEGPHPTLDAALAEIEKHTRGVCRRDPGEDGPYGLDSISTRRR
jgi:hypothetical protein